MSMFRALIVAAAATISLACTAATSGTEVQSAAQKGARNHLVSARLDHRSHAPKRVTAHQSRPRTPSDRAPYTRGLRPSHHTAACVSRVHTPSLRGAKAPAK